MTFGLTTIDIPFHLLANAQGSTGERVIDFTTVFLVGALAIVAIGTTMRIAIADRDRKERELLEIDAMIKRALGSEPRCSECGCLFPNDNELRCRRCGEPRRINHA